MVALLERRRKLLPNTLTIFGRVQLQKAGCALLSRPTVLVNISRAAASLAMKKNPGGLGFEAQHQGQGGGNAFHLGRGEPAQAPHQPLLGERAHLEGIGG
jgi:hypothetical protein